MSQRSTIERLEDAKYHAMAANALIASMPMEMIKTVAKYDHATRSYLIIMGEAMGFVPSDIKARHSDIPWDAIKGLRNRLVHAYWRIDIDIIQRIVRDDVPVLASKLDRMIADVREGAA